MVEFEGLVGASNSGNIDDFRKNFISRLGAWSVERAGKMPPKDLPYEEIFPDIFEKVRQALHEKQSLKIKLMASHLLDVSALDMALMTDRRIRHLPVVEGGRLLGVISIGDLVKWRIAEAHAEVEAVRSFIQP